MQKMKVWEIWITKVYSLNIFDNTLRNKILKNIYSDSTSFCPQGRLQHPSTIFSHYFGKKKRKREVSQLKNICPSSLYFAIISLVTFFLCLQNAFVLLWERTRVKKSATGRRFLTSFLKNKSFIFLKIFRLKFQKWLSKKPECLIGFYIKKMKY